MLMLMHNSTPKPDTDYRSHQNIQLIKSRPLQRHLKKVVGHYRLRTTPKTGSYTVPYKSTLYSSRLLPSSCEPLDMKNWHFYWCSGRKLLFFSSSKFSSPWHTRLLPRVELVWCSKDSDRAKLEELRLFWFGTLDESQL